MQAEALLQRRRSRAEGYREPHTQEGSLTGMKQQGNARTHCATRYSSDQLRGGQDSISSVSNGASKRALDAELGLRPLQQASGTEPGRRRHHCIAAGAEPKATRKPQAQEASLIGTGSQRKAKARRGDEVHRHTVGAELKTATRRPAAEHIGGVEPEL